MTAFTAIRSCAATACAFNHDGCTAPAITVGGTAGNFQLKVSAAAATNYKAVEKIVTVKGRFVKEPQKQSFADVPADAYYYGAVEWAAEQGVTAGMKDGTFRPGDACTRAQIVTFLYRLYVKA